jgi:hypothetical protein
MKEANFLNAKVRIAAVVESAKLVLRSVAVLKLVRTASSRSKLA